jgi:hypothetical protein
MLRKLSLALATVFALSACNGYGAAIDDVDPESIDLEHGSNDGTGGGNQALGGGDHEEDGGADLDAPAVR